MGYDAICQLLLQLAFEGTAMSPLPNVCKNKGGLRDSKSLDIKCLATQVKIVFCAVRWCMYPILNAVQTEENDQLLLVIAKENAFRKCSRSPLNRKLAAAHIFKDVLFRMVQHAYFQLGENVPVCVLF